MRLADQSSSRCLPAFFTVESNNVLTICKIIFSYSPFVISKYDKFNDSICCFTNGLSEYIQFKTSEIPMYIGSTFDGNVEIEKETIEWAIRWFVQGETNFFESFCNTVPTPPWRHS